MTKNPLFLYVYGVRFKSEHKGDVNIASSMNQMHIYPHEPDHVIAEKHGGPTSLDNLAWACSYCNRFKGSDLSSVDPISHKIVSLFNPRKQKWSHHFRLSGNLIEGITSSSRATVALLHMNDAEQLGYRSV